jgi:hypothetical protein
MPAGDRCGAKFRPLQLFLISGMELFLISGVIIKTPLLQNTCAVARSGKRTSDPASGVAAVEPEGRTDAGRLQ